MNEPMSTVHWTLSENVPSDKSGDTRKFNKFSSARQIEKVINTNSVLHKSNDQYQTKRPRLCKSSELAIGSNQDSLNRFALLGNIDILFESPILRVQALKIC